MGIWPIKIWGYITNKSGDIFKYGDMTDITNNSGDAIKYADATVFTNNISGCFQVIQNAGKELPKWGNFDYGDSTNPINGFSHGEIH